MIDNKRIVDFVTLADAIVKKAGEERARAASERAERAKQAEDVRRSAERAADALIVAGRFKQAQRDDVVAALRVPQKALGCIAKLAAQQTPQAIGRPESQPEKTASAPEPRASGPKASDLAWRAAVNRLPSVR